MINDNNNSTTTSKKRKVVRSCDRININLRRNRDGTLEQILPRQSAWFITYVQAPNIGNEKFHNRFRRRFRCQYISFQKLLNIIELDPKFNRWMSTDAAGRESSPLCLLLLGALRYIGRGWTFDDLEENTSINEETHRQFLHVFIDWGSSVFFSSHVKYPTVAGSVANCHMTEMESCGLHGCIASTDATHITMFRCPVLRANEHMGSKESLPSRTYNISVNHRRQILHTTKGHPARWNDKTLAIYDEFIMGVKGGNLLADNKFQLFEKNNNGEVITRWYSGCWILCDNGYHAWPTMMSPMKDAILFTEVRWSKWLESVRKDVECTFGILKGRFRILKTGIRLHSIESVDKLWCTCCALHNFLLEEDGLAGTWYEGTVSDWEGELGNHNIIDDATTTSDLSAIGSYISDKEYNNDLNETIINNNRNDLNETNNNNNNTNNNNIYTTIINENNNPCIAIRTMQHNEFREKLIEHFDILFTSNKLKWPTRTGTKEPDVY